MSAQEVEAYITEEVENNPFLEWKEEVPANDVMEIAELSNLRYNTFYDSSSFESNDNQPYRKTLKDFINEQIILTFQDVEDKKIAFHLCDSLDDNGYLRESTQNLANNLNIEANKIDSILAILKTFEPSGVFANNLHDCLKIQLREKNMLTKEYDILLSSLHYIYDGKLPELCKLLKLKEADIKQMLGFIKTLDPKPGRNYSAEVPKVRKPDVYVYQTKQGDYRAVLYDDVTPKLLVNEELYDNALKTEREKSKHKFCNYHFQHAKWVLSSIAQRNETILRIANEIAIKQYEFFARGPSHLKPMRLIDLAAELDLHESTVSRAGNAVIACSFGVFDLKYFFSSGLSSNICEDSISSKVAKQVLKDLVAKEKSLGRIFSDEELSIKMKELGINISRRTVAKYRDALQIQPSHIRKRKLAIS